MDLSNGGLELHAFGLVVTLSAYNADRSFAITTSRYGFGSYFISLLDGVWLAAILSTNVLTYCAVWKTRFIPLNTIAYVVLSYTVL